MFGSANEVRPGFTGTAGRGSRKGGYTLVEVMMAVLIVSLILVAGYGTLAVGFNTTRATREELRATQILIDHMEGLRAFNWSELTDPNNSPNFAQLCPSPFTNYYYTAELIGTNTSSTALGLAYIGTVTVTNLTLNPVSSYSANMRLVTVTLTWNAGYGVRSNSMSMYVARYGVQNIINQSLSESSFGQ